MIIPKQKAFWDSVKVLSLRNQSSCLKIYLETKDEYWLQAAMFYEQHAKQFAK